MLESLKAEFFENEKALNSISGERRRINAGANHIYIIVAAFSLVGLIACILIAIQDRSELYVGIILIPFSVIIGTIAGKAVNESELRAINLKYNEAKKALEQSETNLIRALKNVYSENETIKEHSRIAASALLKQIVESDKTADAPFVYIEQYVHVTSEGVTYYFGPYVFHTTYAENGWYDLNKDYERFALASTITALVSSYASEFYPEGLGTRMPEIICDVRRENEMCFGIVCFRAINGNFKSVSD